MMIVGDTVRYLGSGEDHKECHYRMTIDSDYFVYESSDGEGTFTVLDDDGDEICVLDDEFIVVNIED